MKSEQQIERSLRGSIAHTAQFTTAATVATFNRTFGAPVEALAGGLGAFLGLGGSVFYGLTYSLYASVVLDVSAFGGCGLLFALGARLLGSRSRRARDEERRAALAFQHYETEYKLGVLNRLPTWLDKSLKAEFGREVLQSLSGPDMTDRQGQRPGSNMIDRSPNKPIAIGHQTSDPDLRANAIDKAVPD